ncbi:reverse transcriptase domain-containing protein [Tanacetum coccineum]
MRTMQYGNNAVDFGNDRKQRMDLLRLSNLAIQGVRWEGGVIAPYSLIEKNGKRGRVAAMALSWDDFKALMVEEFCPSNEMEKLENEFWNHKMVGANHAAYTDRFHELAKLVPHLVTPESSRIKRYIAGLAPEIRGMLRATQPTTIQTAILRAGILTDEAVSCGTLTKGSDKRKGVDEPSKTGGFWKDNKKAKTGTGNEILQIVLQVSNNWVILSGIVGTTVRQSSSGECSDFSFISTEFAPLLNVRPSIVNPGYVIEVADGKKVEVDRIIRDCKLENRRAFEECFQGIVGLPSTTEQVEFRIDLVPGATPIVKSPYSLAPSEIRSFLGLAGYYRRFSNFSKIAKPLTSLTQKNQKVEDFVVFYDASNLGLGCVLHAKRQRTLIRYLTGKANVVTDALSKKERLKPRRVRALAMTVQIGMRERIQVAQSEALRKQNILIENLHGLDQQMEKKEGESLLFFMDRIWVPLIGDVRTIIMDEAHKTKYSGWELIRFARTWEFSGRLFRIEMEDFCPLLADCAKKQLANEYLLGGAIDSSEANGIIRDPKLELENSRFTFDLVPLSYESVDVVVGENWLLRHKAEMKGKRSGMIDRSCKVRGVRWLLVIGSVCIAGEERRYFNRTPKFKEEYESHRKDDVESVKERRCSGEVFKQRGSGSKGESYLRCRKNQIVNE